MRKSWPNSEVTVKVKGWKCAYYKDKGMIPISRLADKRLDCPLECSNAHKIYFCYSSCFGDFDQWFFATTITILNILKSIKRKMKLQKSGMYLFVRLFPINQYVYYSNRVNRLAPFYISRLQESKAISTTLTQIVIGSKAVFKHSPFLTTNYSCIYKKRNAFLW